MRLPSGASRAEGRLDITHTTRRRGRTEPLRQEPLSRPERTQHTRAGAQEQKRLEDREKDSSFIMVDKRGHMQASTIINHKKKYRRGRLQSTGTVTKYRDLYAGDREAAGAGGKLSSQRPVSGDLDPDKKGASEAGEKNWTSSGV